MQQNYEMSVLNTECIYRDQYGASSQMLLLLNSCPAYYETGTLDAPGAAGY